MARIARGVSSSRLALLDEPGLLEHLGQLAEAVERAGGVVAEQLAGAVEVDLGQLARLGGGAHEVLELVEVAERVEQAGHLAELQRVVAAEVLRALPRQVGERLLQVARELVDLPAQVHVLHERLGERLRCSGVIELISCCIAAIDCAICSSSSSRFCGLPGKNSPWRFHEPVEVGLLAALALLEHLVELVEHVLHLRHALGRHVLHALGELVEVALHQLLAQLVHQLLEPLARGVVHELVLLERLHRPARSGGSSSSSRRRSSATSSSSSPVPLVTGARRLLDPAVDALALHVDDFVELLGDVVVPRRVWPVSTLAISVIREEGGSFLEHLALCP